jgi:hypothetical protein
VVLRHKRVETFGHLGGQIERLPVMDQHVTAITSLDRFLGRSCIA